MKTTILLFVLLQLSLISPNPDAKIEAKPKESEVMIKRNLSNKKRLDSNGTWKKAWEKGKEDAKKIGDEIAKTMEGVKKVGE
jgi:hypothetical protein